MIISRAAIRALDNPTYVQLLMSMDDLISRKAVLDFMKGWKAKCKKGETIEYVRNLPSVPAVPLDKLCEYLNSVIYPSIICKESPGPQCNAKRKGCWDRVLTKWMEEQDASD